MTDEKFELHRDESTKLVKSYWTDMEEDWRPHYGYLRKLDRTCDSYDQYGADKAGVNDMPKFCELLDLNMNDLKEQVRAFPLGRDGNVTTFEMNLHM